MGAVLSKKQLQMTAIENRVQALNPRSVLSRGYSITLKGSRIEDADTGERDTGQAAVEAVMDEMGPDALLGYRITSPAASGAEELEFKAWASVTPLGGSDKATWGAVLHVYGEIERA